LDTRDIEMGDHFPRVIIDALLASRVVVVFADDTYFDRWYCLRELRTALAPSDLSHIVLALPDGPLPSRFSNLPSVLRNTLWPHATETSSLVERVRAALDRNPLSIYDRLSNSSAIRATLLEEAAILPPQNLAGTPHYPPNVRPSIGAQFVGRAKDLDLIHFTICAMRGDPSRSAALTGALEAASGFGKTRIALEYVHRYGPAYYPGGVFWIDADVDEISLEEQLHGILSALRQVPDLYTFRSQQRNVRRELSAAIDGLPSDKPILFVVDNVPEKSPRPLADFCPALGRVAVLATSRRKLDLGVEAVQSLPLRELDRTAAITLLSEGVGPSGEWDEIAKWVGDLPLALELLNRVLKAGVISPHELVERARRSGPALELDRYMEALREHIPAGMLRGVTEALTVSYELLKPEWQRAARLLAQLSPAMMPAELLSGFGDEVNSSDMRAALVTRSLVSAFPGGTMHRVIADYLRSCSPDPESELLCAVNATVSCLDHVDCRIPQQWPLLNLVLPHAEWLFRRSCTLFDSRRDARAGGAVLLGMRSGSAYLYQGLWVQALPLHEATLRLAVESLGAAHVGVPDVMNNLAATLRARGDLARATDLDEQALAIRRQTLGERNEATIAAMGGLANSYCSQRRFSDAIGLYEKALVLSKDELGEEHEHTLMLMHNLAGALSQPIVEIDSARGTVRLTPGNLPAALALHEQVFSIRKRVHGDEHPDTLMSAGNIAEILRVQGKLAEARSLLEPTLAAQRRVLKEHHPDTSQSGWRLYEILRDLGDPTANDVLQSFRWMIDRDPESLSAGQRRIRELARALLSP
jgi:tetratricopeptide (TPR) repeat protein